MEKTRKYQQSETVIKNTERLQVRTFVRILTLYMHFFQFASRQMSVRPSVGAPASRARPAGPIIRFFELPASFLDPARHRIRPPERLR